MGCCKLKNTGVGVRKSESESFFLLPISETWENSLQLGTSGIDSCTGGPNFSGHTLHWKQIYIHIHIFSTTQQLWVPIPLNGRNLTLVSVGNFIHTREFVNTRSFPFLPRTVPESPGFI